MVNGFNCTIKIVMPANYLQEKNKRRNDLKGIEVEMEKKQSYMKGKIYN